MKTGTDGLIGRQAQPSTKRKSAQDWRPTQDLRDFIQFPKVMMNRGKKEIKGDRPPLNPAQGSICKSLRNKERARNQHKQRQASDVRASRKMASSSTGKMSTEERLKEMDKTLANLQQMLQHQLDFL
jgi:hypothetical protein